MFCKWCGGNLTPSDTKCKRCGKAVPALSDCGGFYDLVPNAKRNEEAHPVSVQPAMVHPAPVLQPERKMKRRKLPAGLIALIVALVLAIVILLLIFVLSKVNKSKTPKVKQSVKATQINDKASSEK